jgi:hypothetical protein
MTSSRDTQAPGRGCRSFRRATRCSFMAQRGATGQTRRHKGLNEPLDVFSQRETSDDSRSSLLVSNNGALRWKRGCGPSPSDTPEAQLIVSGKHLLQRESVHSRLHFSCRISRFDSRVLRPPPVQLTGREDVSSHIFTHATDCAFGVKVATAAYHTRAISQSPTTRRLVVVFNTFSRVSAPLVNQVVSLGRYW